MDYPHYFSENQRRIMDAAFSLIAKEGYRGTTTRQIAGQAEVNESTLFKNFKGKQEIFQTAHKVQNNVIQQKVDTFFAKKFSGLSTFLEDSTLFIYTLYMEHSDMVMVMLRELGNPDLSIGENSPFEFVTSALVRILQQFLPEKSRPALLTSAFMLVSSIIFLILDQIHSNLLTDELEDKVSLERISQMVYQMLK